MSNTSTVRGSAGLASSLLSPSNLKPAADSAGSSLDHFAFDIADYDDALARVEKTGLKFRAVTTPGTSVKQIFVRDPNGVTIELNWKGDRPRG